MGHGGYLRMKTWPDVHSRENMNTEWFRGSRWVVNDVDRVFHPAPDGADVHVLDLDAMEREGVREGIEEGRRVFGNDSQSRRTTPFLFGSPFSGVGCQAPPQPGIAHTLVGPRLGGPSVGH